MNRKRSLIVLLTKFLRKFLFNHLIIEAETRLNIAKEILSTEQNYVNWLGLVIKVFLQPLRTKVSILTPQQVKKILRNFYLFRFKDKNYFY